MDGFEKAGEEGRGRVKRRERKKGREERKGGREGVLEERR